MDIKILENLMQVTIDRGNLRNRHHQVIQKRILVNLGLLKSGKVELRSTIDRGNLREFLGIYCKKLTNIFESRISAGAKDKLPTRASGKPDAETISSWFYDMEGLANMCGIILRICN